MQVTQETLIPLLEALRELIPRQVDKKSRVPQGERGLEFSRRWKGQTFFLYILSVQSVQFSRSVLSDSLGLVLVNYTTQFKLYTRDYTTTMYPA